MIEIPNGERVVADYLRQNGHPRVRAQAPPDTDRATAWITLTMLDATDAALDSETLIAFLIQLDCYAGKAGGQPEAVNAARDARRLLKEMPETDFADVVVTAARFVNMARVPDPDGFEPARERVILTARIYMRNARGSS